MNILKNLCKFVTTIVMEKYDNYIFYTSSKSTFVYNCYTYSFYLDTKW